MRTILLIVWCLGWPVSLMFGVPEEAEQNLTKFGVLGLLLMIMLTVAVFWYFG